MSAFFSLQDTVVALKALTEYHRRTDDQPINMAVSVTADADQRYGQSMRLTAENRRIVNTIEEVGFFTLEVCISYFQASHFMRLSLCSNLIKRAFPSANISRILQS